MTLNILKILKKDSQDFKGLKKFLFKGPKLLESCNNIRNKFCVKINQRKFISFTNVFNETRAFKCKPL